VPPILTTYIIVFNIILYLGSRVGHHKRMLDKPRNAQRESAARGPDDAVGNEVKKVS